MTDAIIQQLIQGGSMGLFAAFLVWQFIGLQKRLDNLVKDFRTQLVDIQSHGDQHEEKLRDRYDAVIEKTEAEKADLRDNVVKAVEENARKLDAALDKLDTGLTEMRDIRSRSRTSE